MHIRPFLPDDTEAVVHLWTICHLVTAQNNPYQDIACKMQIHPELFLVGENNGNIVASVMGGYEGHRGWLNYLAVSPEERGKGYGKEIVRAVERLIKRQGAQKINLQVRTSNRAVIDFYQRLGYQVEEVVSLGKRLKQNRGE